MRMFLFPSSPVKEPSSDREFLAASLFFFATCKCTRGGKRTPVLSYVNFSPLFPENRISPPSFAFCRPRVFTCSTYCTLSTHTEPSFSTFFLACVHCNATLFSWESNYRQNSFTSGDIFVTFVDVIRRTWARWGAVNRSKDRRPPFLSPIQCARSERTTFWRLYGLWDIYSWQPWVRGPN